MSKSCYLVELKRFTLNCFWSSAECHAVQILLSAVYFVPCPDPVWLDLKRLYTCNAIYKRIHKINKWAVSNGVYVYCVYVGKNVQILRNVSAIVIEQPTSNGHCFLHLIRAICYFLDNHLNPLISLVHHYLDHLKVYFTKTSLLLIKLSNNYSYFILLWCAFGRYWMHLISIRPTLVATTCDHNSR